MRRVVSVAACAGILAIGVPVRAQATLTSEDLNRAELARLAAEAGPPCSPQQPYHYAPGSYPYYSVFPVVGQCIGPGSRFWRPFW